MNAHDISPKIIIHTAMSLDGFITGPGDDMSWIFNNDEPTLDLSNHIASIGAVIMGRRTQEMDIKQRQKPDKNFVYGGEYTGPVYVLSKKRNEQEKDPNIQYIFGDIAEKIQEVKNVSKGGNILLLGANVWRQALKVMLVDEILIHIIPVLLGDGIRFYSVPGARLEELKLVEATRIGKLAQLRFNVRRKMVS